MTKTFTITVFPKTSTMTTTTTTTATIITMTTLRFKNKPMKQHHTKIQPGHMTTTLAIKMTSTRTTNTKIQPTALTKRQTTIINFKLNKTKPTLNQIRIRGLIIRTTMNNPTMTNLLTIKDKASAMVISNPHLTGPP